MNCSHATLGKNIRTLRNARGLSQEALAQDAQITQSHLGCIERGRGNPTVETLFSICNALQVDIAELFQDTSAILSAPTTPQLSSLQGKFELLSPNKQRIVLNTLRALISWDDLTEE